MPEFGLPKKKMLGSIYVYMSMLSLASGFQLVPKHSHHNCQQIRQNTGRTSKRFPHNSGGCKRALTSLGSTSLPNDEQLQSWQMSRIQEMLKSTDINPGHVQEMFAPSTTTARRYHYTPLKQYGCVFQLDCLVDLETLYRMAWELISKEIGKPAPSLSQARRSIGLNPTDAVRRIFQWTLDFKEARQIGLLLRSAMEQVGEEYTPVRRPRSQGLLEKLRAEQVPVAVVAHVSADLGHRILGLCELQNYVKCGIFQEDEYGPEVADSQGFLKAALKLQTAPKNICVFDCRPEGLLAAHDVDMKVVGVMGEYPGYELNVADLTVMALDDVNPNFNLRRIFESDPEPEPEPEVEVETKRRVQVMTKTRTEEVWMEPQTEGEGYRIKPAPSRKNTYDRDDDSGDGFFKPEEEEEYDLLYDALLHEYLNGRL